MIDGNKWPPTLLAALVTLAAGPMAARPAGFVPSAESIAPPSALIRHQTMTALQRRGAAKVRRARHRHYLATITPHGQFHAARFLALEADALAAQHCETEHEQWMRDVEFARVRLIKLTVAELRVLHQFYFGEYSGADEMGKPALLDELAPEIVDDDR